MFARVLAALLAFMFVSPAWADGRADLRSAFAQTLKLTAFRATMHELPSGKPVSSVEFQAPDRYRVTPAGGAASVIIGDTMYLQAGGRPMKIPLPKNMLGQFRNEAAIAELEKGITVESLGPGMVGKQLAKKFRFTTTGKHPSTSTAWVGTPSGRVLQIETAGTAAGKAHSMRIVYSDFNSPAIKIPTPR